MISRSAPRVVVPWAALTLMTLCTAAAIYHYRLGDAGDAWLRYWGLVPARLEGGLPSDPATLTRLITALFVHVDFWHLVWNGVFLALFAPRVEARLGSLRSFALYLFCGALANAVSVQLEPALRAPIVGSSGIISALIGAFLVLYPRARIGIILPLGLYWEIVQVPALLLIGGWFALQVMYTVFGPTLAAVAWWTHIAGFLSGLILAAPARWFPTRSHRTL